MTFHEANYSGGLGGLQNGGYWQALAQASGGAANQSSAANLGALGAAAASYARQPDTIEDAGIRAGEIIGYRAWFLNDGLLHSMYASFIWFPGVVERAHEITESWGTGLHAFKTLHEARQQYTYANVWGEVALWGDVFEHEKGYRAEFAAVRRIIKVSPDVPILQLRRRLLQTRYCKPITEGPDMTKDRKSKGD
jgi:hypothetical protein